MAPSDPEYRTRASMRHSAEMARDFIPVLYGFRQTGLGRLPA